MLPFKMQGRAREIRFRTNILKKLDYKIKKRKIIDLTLIALM